MSIHGKRTVLERLVMGGEQAFEKPVRATLELGGYGCAIVELGR
ncbi:MULTISPECIES: hypothetical protein [Rhizobium]|nr:MULTISPECIES: hypothetical protein [Rhizobium]MDE8763302.1 hypothetical protein [Rhizobium sp. CBK13]